jgi:hypothetical protein
VRSSSSCRQADSGSECLGYRVAGEEAGESAGHGGGVLRVQEMGEAGQVEWLGVGLHGWGLMKGFIGKCRAVSCSTGISWQRCGARGTACSSVRKYPHRGLKLEPW